jgi:hypothetical protein
VASRLSGWMIPLNIRQIIVEKHMNPDPLMACNSLYRSIFRSGEWKQVVF